MGGLNYLFEDGISYICMLRLVSCAKLTSIAYNVNRPTNLICVRQSWSQPMSSDETVQIWQVSLVHTQDP